MLMEILLLFIPGIIGVLIYKKIEKKTWDICEYIETYALLTFLIYFGNCFMLYARGWEEFSISTMGLVAQVKYGVLSVGFAVVLPCVFWCGKKVWTLFLIPTE